MFGNNSLSDYNNPFNYNNLSDSLSGYNTPYLTTTPIQLQQPPPLSDSLSDHNTPYPTTFSSTTTSCYSTQPSCRRSHHFIFHTFMRVVCNPLRFHSFGYYTTRCLPIRVLHNAFSLILLGTMQPLSIIGYYATPIYYLDTMFLSLGTTHPTISLFYLFCVLCNPAVRLIDYRNSGFYPF